MSYCYLSHDDRKLVCAPPKMADGRILTDYRSSSLVDVSIQGKVKTPNQYEYRQFLIKNGYKVAAEQKHRAKQTMTATTLPKKASERFMTVCQGNRCEVMEINPRGIGIGRQPTSGWTPITPSPEFLQSYDVVSGPSLYKTLQ